MLARMMGLALVAGAVAAGPATAATIVLSNNTVPGDSFSNTTLFPNNALLQQGQAVGTSGWYYNNVRGAAATTVIGIRDNIPRSGSGSVYFRTTSGSAKADIEFLPNASANFVGNRTSGGSLGSFQDLATFGYDWYRDSSSTNNAIQHPVMRVLIDLDGNPATTGDRAGLVFERAYNGGSVPVDTWVTDTIGAESKLWSFGALGFATDITGSGTGYDQSLATWQSWMAQNHPNAVIVGFSLGVGSGWNDTFEGAVDNAFWTIGDQTWRYNFEVFGATPVPEPATLALLGAGLLGLALARRRA